jgi:hypothetical protein
MLCTTIKLKSNQAKHNADQQLEQSQAQAKATADARAAAADLASEGPPDEVKGKTKLQVCDSFPSCLHFFLIACLHRCERTANKRSCKRPQQKSE